jgi:KDO2-lipid IV(A) lauroyltransferase
MKKVYDSFFNCFFRLCYFTYRWRFFRIVWYKLGFYVLLLFRYRESVLNKNLDIAFELSPQQKSELRKKIYRFLSYEVSYFISLCHTTPADLKANTKIIADQKTLDLCASKTPLILLSGHTLGVWLGVLFSACFRHCYTYTYHGPQKDSYEIYNMFEKIAAKFPLTVISHSKTEVFKMRKCLKNNHCLSIVGDFNVQHTDTFVNFFGKPASIGEGAFRLALRTKTPIVFAHVAENDQKQILFSLKQIYSPAADPAANVQELANRFNSELEKKVRQKPHCYFWTNKRWKTRPKGDKEQVYAKRS